MMDRDPELYQPSRFSMFFRELACQLLGHRWRNINAQYLGLARSGKYCTRCFNASVKNFTGQYPLRRG